MLVQELLLNSDLLIRAQNERSLRAPEGTWPCSGSLGSVPSSVRAPVTWEPRAAEVLGAADTAARGRWLGCQLFHPRSRTALVAVGSQQLAAAY